MSGTDTLPETFDGDNNKLNYDTITVRLVAEKKGMFLKHTEYEVFVYLEVSSLNNKSKVPRRYNDFANLQSLLLTKYCYRMIPRLPPKQLMLDSLLEERRSGLERWLKLLSQHPIISKEKMMQVFLSDGSLEQQERLRETFNSDSDEFAHLGENVVLPIEDQGRLAASRELMRTMLNSVSKIKRLMDNQIKRADVQSKDLADISSVLNLITKETRDSTFSDLAIGFNDISGISEKYCLRQQSAITERFNIILDVLIAHSDLCDRVEKGIASEHQNMSRMLQINKQKLKGVIRGTAGDNVNDLNVRQRSEVENLGKRSAFSLSCVLEETKLAQNYLKCLPSIMLSFVNEEHQGFKQIAEAWNNILIAESDKLNQ